MRSSSVGHSHERLSCIDMTIDGAAGSVNEPARSASYLDVCMSGDCYAALCALSGGMELSAAPVLT
jgi:hypothetical protein